MKKHGVRKRLPMNGGVGTEEQNNHDRGKSQIRSLWHQQRKFWLLCLMAVGFFPLMYYLLFTGKGRGGEASKTTLHLVDHLLEDCHGVNLKPNDDVWQVVRTKTAAPFDMSIYPKEQDIWVSSSIAQEGCWECNLVKLVTDTLQQHDEGYLVDIGGNIGMFSLSVAAMGRTAFVFEPLKSNYDHICRSVVMNRLHSRFNLFRVAATRQPSKVILSAPATNKGGTSSKAVDAEELTALQQEGVHYANGISIDSVRKYFPKNLPVIVKIDVEGAEIEALTGAMEFFRESNLVLALMELRPGAMLKSPSEMDTIFKSFVQND